MLTRVLLALVAVSTLTACAPWPSDSQAGEAGTNICRTLEAQGVERGECLGGFLEGWQAGRAAGGYVPDTDLRRAVEGMNPSRQAGYLAGAGYARTNAPT